MLASDESPKSRWDEFHAAALGEPERLLYRSNLLGSDKRITNFGGGNTSAKIAMEDPLTGERADVLWVKGSGGDLGSMGLDGFATLYLEKLEALKGRYRGLAHEDEMLAYLPHCTFNLNPRAASIDTPLHALIPHAHVDHMHPDAVIAIAASRQGERITEEIFGADIGWLRWQRPGFDLGLKLEELSRAHPGIKGVILESHGLFTWGESSRSCYENTLAVIRTATEWLKSRPVTQVFGGIAKPSLPESERRSVVAALAPAIRGLIGVPERKVGHYDASPEVLEFVNSRCLKDLAALGTSCPDHFLRTKIRPLVLDIDSARLAVIADFASTNASSPAETGGGLGAQLAPALEAYRSDYRAYYERCRHVDSTPMRDPNPVVFLIPGVGMLTFAKDKATARIAGEFYLNAIHVMRGASSVDTYVGLPEQEAFDIEYWALEEAKLKRVPPPKSLAGRIALITGAGGGIGEAVAQGFASEGACVLMTDIDPEALSGAAERVAARYGNDLVRAVPMDVTQESAVARALEAVLIEFGGLDILVSNAGIASASPLEETTLELWNTNQSVLTTGYFLVSRAAFRAMRRQGLGGSIVFVGSKNALAASPNASAYCTAKAAELHLARCLALEGADQGIRVNTVNPDAVLKGSRIWSGSWRAERAQNYDLKENQLEDFYIQRSLLKRAVYPEDVAEAVYFFASDLSFKSTGNVLNVDAGNAAAFPR